MGIFDIRPARMEDAPQIAAVNAQSWKAAYHGLIPQTYLDGLEPAQRVGRWEQTLSEVDWTLSGILVADAGASLLGFIYYAPSRDDDADQDRVGEIYAEYVVPDAWGKGIGRQLMDTALKRVIAVGHDQASLWVLDTNTRARRFYESGGWSADGAVKRDDAFNLPVTLTRYRKQLP